MNPTSRDEIGGGRRASWPLAKSAPGRSEAIAPPALPSKDSLGLCPPPDRGCPALHLPKASTRTSRIASWTREIILVLPALAALSFLVGCSDEPTVNAAPVFQFAPESGVTPLDAAADPDGAHFLVDLGLIPQSGSKHILPFLNQGRGSLEIAIQTGSRFVSASAPKQIASGAAGSIDLRIAGAPAGELSALITLTTNEPATLRLRVVAEVGGSAISCDAAALDFGDVFLGEATQRRVECINSLGAPIQVGARIEPADAAFVAAVEGAASLLRVDAGATFAVLVDFQPETLGHHTGNLDLVDGGGQRLLRAAAMGSAIAGPLIVRATGCIDFGLVHPGSSRRASLLIQNVDDAPHRLTTFALDHTDFSVGVAAPLPLAPGAGLELPIDFLAAASGQARAALVIETDGPGRPLEACLQASVGGPRLRCEAAVDFPLTRVGEVRTQSLRCTNDGVEDPETPLQIRGVESSHPSFDAAIFELDGSPGPSDEGYAKGEGFRLELRFHPETEGDAVGTLTLASNSSDDLSSPLQLQLRGSAVDGPVCDLKSEVLKLQRPKVDLLWVLDNSGVGWLEYAFPALYPQIVSAAGQTDFQIGVTTSGLYSGGSCPGGAHGGENGRLFPVDGSSPRIITSSMSHADQQAAWAYNSQVGDCHWDEQFYEAARRALSPPLIDNADDPRTPQPNDGNLGFLRDDANLSIVFFGDERDHAFELGPDHWTPADYIHFFQSLKPSPRQSVKLHSLGGPRSNMTKRCAVEYNDDLLDGVDATGGVWLDLCEPGPYDSPTWLAAIETLSQGIFSESANRLLLGALPNDINGDGVVDANDIEMWVDGFKLYPITRTGGVAWTYDAATNSIRFGDLAVPPTGSQIIVHYLECEDDE